MTGLEKALNHLTEQVKLYRELDSMDGEGMVKCLQQISATLYYLETLRSDFHKAWQKIVNELVIKGDTVSRAENHAHVHIPELYKLRHIMSSAYVVCDAIRSQSSWIKMEMNSVK